MSCHQAQGQGVANQYPPLAGSRWVIGEAEVTRRILLHGLQGPIEVLGKTYNGNMPAFARQLSDEQIAAVITYIRQAWGNEASAVDTASVTRSREATKDQREPYRAEEVENATPPPAPAEPAAPDSKSEASDK